MTPIDGTINLDKPAGMTSATAVNRVKHLLPRGTRIGHAGTLDPFATGVLVLLIGRATKLSQMIMNKTKSYETTVKLGAFTETDDLDSPEQPVEMRQIPTTEQIDVVLRKFIGQIDQIPPRYSAKKVGGRRAYELARKGREMNLQSQSVRIDDVQLLRWEPPLLQLRIDCGRGTYIRSIARDLGEKLQTGGYLTALRRTRIGEFQADQSVSLESLARDGFAPHLRPIETPEPGSAVAGPVEAEAKTVT